MRSVCRSVRCFRDIEVSAFSFICYCTVAPSVKHSFHFTNLPQTTTVKKYLICLLIICLLSLFSFGQAPDSTLLEAPSIAESKVEVLEYFFEKEGEHRNYLYNVMKWTYGAGVIVLGLITGLLVFFNKNTAASIQKSVEANLEAEVVKRLETRLAAIDREKIRPLNDHVNFLAGYKKSRIKFFGCAEDFPVLSQKIGPMLIDAMDMEQVIFRENVTSGALKDAEIVVFCHAGPTVSPEADGLVPNPELVKLVGLIKGKNVPLIIYTDGKQGSLNDAERQLVSENIWYTYANMPLSLIHALYATSHTFHAAGR